MAAPFLLPARALPTVLDVADDDMVALRAIADHIGRDRCQLTPPRCRWPSAIRELTQAVTGVDQARREPFRRIGVELGDIGTNQTQLGQRALGPDYLNHFSGAGCSSGLPHVASQAATSA